MAGKLGILACFIVVGLDIAAGMLGIKAEVAQDQEKHLRLLVFECKAPSRDAFVLGVGAAALLGIAHILTNLAGGCPCVNKASPCAHLSILCLVITWIIVAAGLLSLAIGIISNHKSRTSCGLTHHHFLSYGGMLCIAHAPLSVAYYATSTCVN